MGAVACGLNTLTVLAQLLTYLCQSDPKVLLSIIHLDRPIALAFVGAAQMLLSLVVRLVHLLPSVFAFSDRGVCLLASSYHDPSHV